MSSAALVNRLDPGQHAAARLAGILYLAGNVVAAFSEFHARGSLIVPDDAAQTAVNVRASELLFRIGMVGDLVTFSSGLVLVWALYVVLRPVGRDLVLLAAFFRLAECAVLASITLNDFTALRLLGGASYLRALDTQQLQALARLFMGVQADGYRIGLVLFGLGSAVFAWLWYKSCYIPRVLAALGIFASLLVAILTLAIMVFPGLGSMVIPAYYVPVLLFEVSLGLWLLAKGLRAPEPA